MAPIPPQYRAKETGQCDANENMLKIALFYEGDTQALDNKPEGRG